MGRLTTYTGTITGLLLGKYSFQDSAERPLYQQIFVAVSFSPSRHVAERYFSKNPYFLISRLL
jgi:hypothetical protein